VGSDPGGIGSLTTIAPSVPSVIRFPDASSTCTSQPGSGRVGEPGLIGSSSMPAGLATMGHPVSVCHQWSITGMPSSSDAQW
jgi:hypothetical protein